MRRIALAGLITLALGIAWDARAQGGAGTITPRDLVSLRDLNGLSVSPDGEMAAVQVRQAIPDRNGYDIAWFIVGIHNGAVRRIADGGEPILQASRATKINGSIATSPAVWSPDSRWIVYLRRDGDSTQVWRSYARGGRAERLTQSDGDVRSVGIAGDGYRVFFETEPSRRQIETSLEAEASAGFLFDRRFFPVYEQSMPVFPSDLTIGGGSIQEQLSRMLWVYDDRRKRVRHATADERVEFEELSPRLALSGRDRRSPARSSMGSEAWTEARDLSKQGAYAPLTIVARPHGSGQDFVCSAAACTAQRIDDMWWRSEDEIIFLRREGEGLYQTALYSWRIGEAPRLILRTYDRLTAPLEWSCAMAGNELICFHEAADMPRRLVAIDLDSGNIRPLFEPNPGFSQFAIGEVERLTIRSTAGVVTYGYLVLPPDHVPGERHPLVVVTYRCAGFLRGGTGDEYPVYAFAAEGFAVLCFNIPTDDYALLETMSWSQYALWARGQGDPVQNRILETLNAVIADLDRKELIDAERVGVTGLSYGSEVVGFALAHLRIRAGIASGGPGWNPLAYYLYGPAGREQLGWWGLGAPDETPERWREFGFSPNAANVSAPLLLNVADREMMSSLQPVADLERAGRAVEMYVFPDEYHIKWQPEHRLAIYMRNIDWMNFWLREHEDPDPLKRAQYDRWRDMRRLEALADPPGRDAQSR